MSISLAPLTRRRFFASVGNADTADFRPVLKDRAQVKAFVFGHTHTWKLAKKDGIHLINPPAIGVHREVRARPERRADVA